MPLAPSTRRSRLTASGKLRIGDDWNAINIIALSQENPLKAVAELVENSIDAGARNVTITRGKERGEHYLTVADDGKGVPRDGDGIPDFRYVATHVCDSIKRRLKADGARGIQGEFGIGLLSFWTVGEELAMSSTGDDGRVYEMRMRKGDPSYAVSVRPTLVGEAGTRVKIKPVPPGVRQMSGEKIQWFLASELRERIRASGARVRVLDRQARKEFEVVPRQFTGDLLHQVPAPREAPDEIYVELYLNPQDAGNTVGLYRSGTRILPSLADLEAFRRPPWTSGLLQGIVDAPFLNLTPATRSGVVHDAALEAFALAIAPIEAHLLALFEEHKRAEDERSNRDTLRSIQRAFREAMLALPSDEYDWFDVEGRERAPGIKGGRAATLSDRDSAAGATDEATVDDEATLAREREADFLARQRSFFEYAGPLHSVRISPASATLAVGAQRRLRAVARDASRRSIDAGVDYEWRIDEGEGQLEASAGEFATLTAPPAPTLVRITLIARQADVRCEAKALINVTDVLPDDGAERSVARQGLPGYTFEHAPGKLWRSRYDHDRNVIVVNSGHRDFVFSSRAKSLKLRYLARLYAKEMVRKNFPGATAEQLLDRMIELSLYTEENLR